MKIVYVVTRSDEIGGASVHVLDLADGMRRKGHDVWILAGGSGVVSEIAAKRGVDYISLNCMKRDVDPVKDVRGIFELRKMIVKIAPDIVHLHSSKAGVLGRLSCIGLPVGVVFTAHGWAFTEGVSARRRWFYTEVERFMARFTNRIITVSNYDMDLALKLKVCDASLVSSVHNGIPDLQINTEISEANNDVRLIMVARFAEQKNQRALLQALSHLNELNWTLELVGDGPLLQDVQDLARELGLSEKVYFAGACSDVHNRLLASDVFLLVSDWEGLPLVILEAMRAGLPVIASRVGGVPEAIDHGETGFVVDRNDQQGLVRVLRRMLESPELRQQMGLKGREKFNREFVFEDMLERTMLVYSAVLAQE
ncbi:glycosyltransferase family 4 protein [Pseudomonas sp. OIL-1]|uniref:glycosyltransferase family 4 protein n=1 Tax=Pseudomonas sp. OIL-1 TaxID=2706126 RepID=UPI0013A76F77|nr:glycosyltransferase family 4 protein [Pseudomonas sp. OIL-1]QIB52608.1 glycosyltransferase family 4 protein [Pseudomonas sp. OIL-1]